MSTSNDPFHVGMLIFEGMTNLDFAGPFEVFARMPNAIVHVIGIRAGVVTGDVGGLIMPTATIDTCPSLDLFFVGGGPGVNALMEDAYVLEFVERIGRQAKWITSVCTGALVLGAAGLLRGYKAATHWTAMDVLPLLGAIPTPDRVVIDRNRITGGGVTAGIDFGLTIASLLHGEQLAQAMQLGMEYDPEPPYAVGSPRCAPEALLAKVRAGVKPLTDARMAAASRVAFSRRFDEL